MDQLSSLPDAILTEILSLLPIKSAVKTGVLSQRWCNLWTFISAFRVDASFNIDDASSIINDLLPQLKSPEIKTFSLHLLYPRHSYENGSYLATLGSSIGTWVRFLCTRKVHEIDIKYLDNFQHLTSTLPPQLFQCQSLVNLFLTINVVVSLREEINLPNLQKLHLRLHTDANRCVFGNLFKSCPRLKELFLTASLIYCYGDDKLPIVISSPNLESLYILAWISGGDYNKRILVDVDAPNLKFFGASDVTDLKFRFVNELSGLIEAELGCWRDQVNLPLFRAIRNVRTLKLCSNVIDAVNSALDDDDQLPMLRNLSSLIFLETNHYCWKALLCLLNCTPKIEFLTIEMNTRFEEEEFNGEEEEEFNGIPMYFVPPSSLQYIKRMEIGFKEVEDYETMELVMYLLRYTNSLEKLLVKVPTCTSNFEALRQVESDLYEYLCELPGCSKSCHIEVVLAST